MFKLSYFSRFTFMKENFLFFNFHYKRYYSYVIHARRRIIISIQLNKQQIYLAIINTHIRNYSIFRYIRHLILSTNIQFPGLQCIRITLKTSLVIFIFILSS